MCSHGCRRRWRSECSLYRIVVGFVICRKYIRKIDLNIALNLSLRDKGGD